MRIGASLFLIALGAILTFAVTGHVNGVDLTKVGIVLMIVGALGLLITSAFMMTRRRTAVVYPDDAAYAQPVSRVERPL